VKKHVRKQNKNSNFPAKILASESSTVSGVSSASSSVKKGPEVAAEAKPEAAEPAGPTVETEDTMKNLRKTFAGIFGDLQ
jgi:hypothetical protein